MYVIIAGCGRVGASLAEMLSYDRHDVVVIDKDPGSFRRLSDDFNGITLEGFAFDEQVLLESEIKNADAFAAVTNQDSTNLMAAEVASKMFLVPRVVSRLYYVEKELTFYKLGVDYVCSTTLMAERIQEKLFQGINVTLQQDRLDLGIQVVEFVVPEEADGKPAGNVEYGVSSKLVAILRDNRIVEWDAESPLQKGDRIIITMRKEGWKTIRDCLGGAAVDSPACRLNVMPLTGETRRMIEGEPEGAKVIVGGCSAVGAHLAFVLSMEGYEVTVIDRDSSLFERLPDTKRIRFIEGTVYDEEALLKAGVEDASAFAAVTKFDNTNLMASEVARHIFHVPHVVARLFNPDKEETYQALGIEYVCGTRLLAQSILERLLQPLIRTKASCFNNLLDLVEFECPAAWAGKRVDQAVQKSGAMFAYVARRNTGYIPEGNFVLRGDDSITAMVIPGQLQKLERYIRRKQRG